MIYCIGPMIASPPDRIIRLVLGVFRRNAQAPAIGQIYDDTLFLAVITRGRRSWLPATGRLRASFRFL